MSSHRKMFGHIAAAAATSVYAVEYALLPEHVYPSQLDAVTSAYRRLAADRPVALLADSAGGALALGVALRARDEGHPRPAALYLISPWTDMEAVGGSYDTSSDPFFVRETVRGLAAVQDALLRAWRAWDRFEQRSSVRTWLYRITTNVTLTALEGRSRRALPSALGAPEADEPEKLPADAWVQPYAASRDDVRLALVAGLQTLLPTQRAVWLLREALAFPAAEVSEVLGISVGAVKSSLQRARARLKDADLRPDDIVEPESAEARKFLDAYVTAFQSADVDVLIEVLRADVRLEILPGRQWFDGKDRCAPVFRAAVGEPGTWQMEPTVANGQPAAVARRNGEPYGLAVLDVRRDGIAAVTVFDDPELVARFSPPGPPPSPSRP